MRYARCIAGIAAVSAAIAMGAESNQITDEASAIAVAKRYVKARCTVETVCEFKPRREGKQWNVMVQFTKRARASEKPQPHPSGHVLLYFNQEGQLVRRVEGE